MAFSQPDTKEARGIFLYVNNERIHVMASRSKPVITLFCQAFYPEADAFSRRCGQIMDPSPATDIH